MRTQAKVTAWAIVAGACLAVGAFAMLGLLHAVFSYDGLREASNTRFWGPIAVLALGVGSWSGWRAFRLTAELATGNDRQE
ncbi:MAG: hypothetical protein V3U59_03140 [Gammaproteobacteria bacterium]